MLNMTATNANRDRIIGFLTAKFMITDWLSIRGRANLDKTMDLFETKYSQGTILWTTNPGGFYGKANITNTNKWFDVMLEGDNKISPDFKINYRAGAIYQDVNFDLDASSSDGLNVINKFSLNFASNPTLQSDGHRTQTQSIFGQANASFKDAIFLEASIRNDWDSRLPSPHSYTYYSVGASGVISDLVKLPAPISFLKANINYAEVGNGGQDQVLNTTYQYSQGAGQGFLSRSPTFPIPGLKPEIVKNIEFGVDARFLNDRIGFTLTYYKSNSYNQLLRVSLPSATGYANQYINAGNIQNKGVEITVTGMPIRGKDFSWETALNLAFNRNKVIKLSDVLKITPLAGGFGRSATPVVQEGGSYGDLLSYKWARDSKGRLLVSDSIPVTTDKLGDDQTYIGNFNPRATLGFSNTFQYKGFSLRVLVDGRFGGVVVSGTEMNLAFSGIPEVTEKYREGGWNLGGVDAGGNSVSTQTTAQKFWQTASGQRYGVAEFFAYNATSFRVRELSLGYDIPIRSGLFVKSIKFSAVARNVFWLYRGKSILDIPGLGKRKMWFDPDMSLSNNNFQGVEYGTLPSTRTMGFNLRLTF
jgi:outer membrane receptor protein involved in Fe transport